MNILRKSESIIVLYETILGDDYFSVDINKDYGEYHGKFDEYGFIEFTPELDELEIRNGGDEYIYLGELSQSELRIELENRGFKVKIRK